MKSEMEMPEQPQKKSLKEIYLLERDSLKNEASEIERNVAEIQTARYESALLRLMKKTDDNTELVNAMKEFIGRLEHRSMITAENKLSPDSTARLVKFFEESSEKLDDIIKRTF